MMPSEMAKIIMDLMEKAQKWEEKYDSEPKEEAGSKAISAYLAGALHTLAVVQSVTGDPMECDDESAAAESDGNTLETYITDAVSYACEGYRMRYAAQAYAEHTDETMELILEMFKGYTNNPALKSDEDDGISGEESTARHWIFDGVLGSLPLISSRTVSKDGVVRGLRSCANYIERTEL